jgi:quercetin 2,3-dioxygenase
MTRKVRRIVDTHVHPGMNPQHRVRLVIEPGHWAEFDPFLMLAEDWFVPGTFGDHPHRGFETVTFILEGEVEHRDNHGGHGVLGVGDAQWMTAGRGVVHSEEAGANGTHSLQLWLNLPHALKMTEPRYQDLRGADMPVVRDNGAELRVFSGTTNGITGPALNHVPVTMVEIRLDAGATARVEVPASYNAFAYIISGSTTLAEATQVIWFEREPGEIAIPARTPTHIMFFAGDPIGEPVASRGPFVMNTMNEIVQAYADYQAGRF